MAGLLEATGRLTETLDRRAARILLLFQRRPGHEHLLLTTMKKNYTLLLKDTGLATSEIEERLDAKVQEWPAVFPPGILSEDRPVELSEKSRPCPIRTRSGEAAAIWRSAPRNEGGPIFLGRARQPALWGIF